MNSVLPRTHKSRKYNNFAISIQNHKKRTYILLIYQKLFECNFADETFSTNQNSKESGKDGAKKYLFRIILVLL